MARRLALLALLAGVLVAVPGPNDGARAVVPGKNGRIAFVRSAGAGPLEEVLMANPSAAPGPVVNLTNDPLTSDTAPSWSPDGTRVALQRSGPTDHGFQPAWSPDGNWIAFNRFVPSRGNRIFTAAPSGKGLTQVTWGGPNDVHPAWSPDGGRIAFARGGDQDDGLPLHIHTVTLATGATTQVTAGPVQDLMPSWQPL
jgi:TolB protein